MGMTLNSPAFQQNGHIPSKYTCEGEDVSPAPPEPPSAPHPDSPKTVDERSLNDFA